MFLIQRTIPFCIDWLPEQTRHFTCIAYDFNVLGIA